jgi:hypothetical protein
MAAATILVKLQAQYRLVLPSLVHVAPGIIIIAVTLITKNVGLVAVAYVGVGMAQCGWLWLLARPLRAQPTASAQSPPDRARPSILRYTMPLVIGAAIPLIQFMDRLGQSTAGLSNAAAAAYVWAIVLGISAVINRGPNLIFSIHISRPNGVKTNVLAVPLALYGLGLALSVSFILMFEYGISVLSELFPNRLDLIDGLSETAYPLMLALPPLAALPALYRVAAQRFGLTATATMVAAQLGFQLLLSIDVLGLGATHLFAVAISGHTAALLLMGFNIFAHRSKPTIHACG